MNKKLIFDFIFSRADPIVKSYRSDFEIDKAVIDANSEDIPFLYFVRENGTHIYFLYPADDKHWPKRGETIPYLFGEAPREKILDGVMDCVNYHSKEDIKLVLWYNGKRFRTIDMKQAVDLAQGYIHNVKNQWRKEQ